MDTLQKVVIFVIKANVTGQQVNLEIDGRTDEILIEMAMLIDDLFDGAVRISPQEVRKELLQQLSSHIYKHIQEKIEKL